jgi:hypothetical protein
MRGSSAPLRCRQSADRHATAGICHSGPQAGPQRRPGPRHAAKRPTSHPSPRPVRHAKGHSQRTTAASTPNKDSSLSHVVDVGDGYCPALRISRRIASARAAETSGRLASELGHAASPLFTDPYAALLADWQPELSAVPASAGALSSQPSGAAPSSRQTSARCAAEDAIATAYCDELLLRAMGLSQINRITQGDYRQVGVAGWCAPYPRAAAQHPVATLASHSLQPVRRQHLTRCRP